VKNWATYSKHHLQGRLICYCCTWYR